MEGNGTGVAPPPSRPRPSANDFSTAMIHLYRAESARSDGWRRRLDTTTNWAVVTMAASITFALGGEDPQRHAVLLLNSILVTFFLVIEARRYRYYDVLQTRARLLESDFFAPILWPEGPRCNPNWEQWLATDLRHPNFHISFVEALGWRLRRNYGWLYAVLLVAWLVKITCYPEGITSLQEFFDRAALGPVPGWVTVLVGVLFNGTLIALGFLTRSLHHASGEIMPPEATYEKIETTVREARKAEEQTEARSAG